MTVLNELKPGMDERVYENALVYELRTQGHGVEQQRTYPVIDRQIRVGTLIPDLLIDETIIVDTKVVSAFNDSHVAQMAGYLAVTGLQLALLVNFKFASLQWKRIVRTATPEQVT